MQSSLSLSDESLAYDVDVELMGRIPFPRY